jgi:osmoprotectant transport system ATP-binding protein
MIQLEGVSKEYAGVLAVRDVGFAVRQGQTLGLIGTSGCGKTTTLKMINRLIEPTSGRVLIAGQDAAGLDPIVMRRGIGYVIQRVGLLPHRTVADNIGLLPHLEGWPRARVRHRVTELLALVGLEPATFEARYPSQLSGGQQQRVGVARALALDPPIVLMDEPFGALDPIVRDQLQEEFCRIRATVSKTIVLVTHDLGEAFRLSDEVALMHGGKVIFKGPPAAFRAGPTPPFVQEFVTMHLARPTLQRMRLKDAIVTGVAVAPHDPVLDEADTTMKDVVELFLGHPETCQAAVRDDQGRILGAITRRSLLDVL